MGDATKTLADVSVDELALPAKAAKALRTAGYATLEDLARVDPALLAQTKGVGQGSMSKILAAIGEFADDAADEAGDDETEPDVSGAGVTDTAPEGPASRPAPVPVRPKPKPHPAAELSDADRRPRGCVWVRLRKGTRQITCEARISALRETRTVRLYEGYRYPLPPDVELGDVREWHRMIVREAVQPDYEPVTLAEIDVQLWKVKRADVAHFLSVAQQVIERHQGKSAFQELMMAKDGAQQVYRRYCAIRDANPDEKLPDAVAIHTQQNPPLPAGVVPIDAAEDLVKQDRLAFGRTGQQYASERDLARAEAKEAAGHQMPGWMVDQVRAQFEAALAASPNALL